LIKKVFFFQGDTMLFPADFSDTRIIEGNGVPFEFAGDFKNTDIFEIPSIEPDSSSSAITAVSVSTGTLPENWKGIPFRQVLAMLSTNGRVPYAGAMIRACHIAQWRQESRFCGSCGAENINNPAETERRCPKCGRIEFPRICPAVIVIITDDDNKILLAHNKKFKTDVYSLISGFNEAGETLEATVAREIKEETNIQVRDVSYLKSQPWPFPNSLMLGFKARYSSGTVRPDGIEIEDAAWFTKDNLPVLPGEGSLARFLISLWLNDSL
jgi:NAD+ diphosphatase